MQFGKCNIVYISPCVNTPVMLFILGMYFANIRKATLMFLCYLTFLLLTFQTKPQTPLTETQIGVAFMPSVTNLTMIWRGKWTSCVSYAN